MKLRNPLTKLRRNEITTMTMEQRQELTAGIPRSRLRTIRLLEIEKNKAEQRVDKNIYV